MKAYKIPLLALILLLGTAPVFSQDLRNGLVAYWPLDTLSSGTTTDVAYTNTFTAVASPTSGAGQFGNALTFNGTSQYLFTTHGTTNTDTGLPVYFPGAYTICMWVKGAAQTAKGLFCEASTTSANPLLILQTGNATASNTKLDVIIRNNNGTALLNHIASQTVVFNNAWHHIAWVDNRGSVKLYVDGVQDTTNFNYTYTANTLSLNTTTIAALLRSTTNMFFAGSIDDVAVWERALSQAEVDQVRTNGIATPIPQFAPSLTIQPVSQTKNIGDWALFSGFATGSRPLSFQWSSNGIPIAGANRELYRASNLDTNNTGDFYSVTITNAAPGSVTTTNGVITVLTDAPPNVANSLISFWPFDEISNSPPITPDLYSGNNMLLYQMDTTNLVPGQFGNGLTFDGVIQHARRSGGFPIYNNLSHSIAFWVKGQGINQTNHVAFAEANNTNASPLVAFGTDVNGASTSLKVIIRNDPSAGGTPVNNRNTARPVFDGNWHHIVWTDVNGNGRVYVDGVLDETDYTYTRGSVSLLQNTTVAAVTNNSALANWFGGQMDEVAVWNRRLTFAEIQQIRTNGVPAPSGPVAPSITQNPLGTNVFSGATVTFNSAASGASPLTFQWRKGSTDIANATDATLTVSNIQLSDDADYRVVVTNLYGRATSSVAHLTVTQRPKPPRSLGIDFDARSTVNVQNGFQRFVLGGTSGATPTPVTTLYGGVEVTVSGSSGASLDDRLRATPVNGGDLTEDKIYQDFIFASDTGSRGIDVLVNFVKTNQLYTVTIWSFDSSSTGNRVSDWTANGNTITNGYTFDGSVLPTSDTANQFSYIGTSDSNGQILISGRRNAATSSSFGVFLNALQVAIPEMQITNGFIASGTVTLTFFTPNPEQTHKIQTNTSLNNPGGWVDVSGVTFTPGTYSMQAQFAQPADSSRFYRVVRLDPTL